MLVVAKIICLLLAALNGVMMLSSHADNTEKVILGMMSILYIILIAKL